MPTLIFAADAEEEKKKSSRQPEEEDIRGANELRKYPASIVHGVSNIHTPPHITCLDLNGDEKTSNRTDFNSFEHRKESAVKHLHKTVVTLNNNTSYSPVRQSASVTSLSSIAKPLNKDGDEQQTMTPCLVVNPDPIANSTDEKEKNGIKDLNYEAGIVSRLRERFSQIVSGEARDFEAISRARRKRFSLCGYVLATCQASNNNKNHQKQAPMSSYSKTQNFWQSKYHSSKSRFEKASIYSNNQRPEARPRNGLMSQKPGSNTFTQPNPSAHVSRGTEEAVYVIVSPMCDSQNVPAEPVSSPVYSPPHNLQTSASTNFDHLNSTFNRSQERVGGSGYEHQQPAANKLDYKSSEDENTMQSISKLRERFERCSRVAQKTDSLSRPMPRSRSAHVYPSAKILENIQKFENGSKTFEKRPQHIAVSAGKDARNIQSSSPPADPQPIAFKQISLLSNKLVEKHVKDSIDEIDPPSPRLVISSDASPPEEPRPKLLEEAIAKPEHQLTISAVNSNNVTTCDVDIRLEKSVEIKGHPFVPAVSLVTKDRASEVNQSGKLEMQNLLSKFNQKRGAREAFKATI
uniref:Uncharacterized protein n=1 Tax=Ditylenchus dipsaci TaxID=166011 RepID=A0A915D9B0_9BILA